MTFKCSTLITEQESVRRILINCKSQFKKPAPKAGFFCCTNNIQKQSYLQSKIHFFDDKKFVTLEEITQQLWQASEKKRLCRLLLQGEPLTRTVCPYGICTTSKNQ